MFSNPDAVVIVAVVLIVLLALFHPILRLIDRWNPTMIRRFYEFWQSPRIDEDHVRREQEYKNRSEAKRGKQNRDR